MVNGRCRKNDRQYLDKAVAAGYIQCRRLAKYNISGKRVIAIRKEYLTLLVWSCILVFLGNVFLPGSFNTVAAASKNTAAMQALADETDLILARMSLEEKIGQILLMNFRTWETDAQQRSQDFQEYNDEVGAIIKKYHLGNLILFSENARSTEKLTRLTHELQDSAISSGNLPLLIGIDQEGGLITRLGQGTSLPGNMALGAAGKIENAYLAGRIIGEELAVVGINCDFAPDCDVNDNPKNPVINLRSFAADSQVVSALANAMMQGLTDQQIIAVGKHFPGHGNTSVDTHSGLAIVNKTKAEWQAVEALPFRSLIDHQVAMMMSAHIQYPHLDDTQYVSKLTGEKIYLPATLSKKILTGILRNELAFHGVIVTDAMDMKAITDHFGETEAIIMALNAGADLLCNPTAITCEADTEKLDQIYDAIRQSIHNGRLRADRLDEAAGRVIKLKLQSGILDKEKYRENIAEKINKATHTVGSAEHRRLERKLADDAITLYSGESYHPFSLSNKQRVLFVVPTRNEEKSARAAMERLQKEKIIPDVITAVYCYNNEKTVSLALAQQIVAADAIVIISEWTATVLNDPQHWQVTMPVQIVEAVKRANKEKCSVVVSTGLPYDAVQYPELPVYLAYGYQRILPNESVAKYTANLPAAIDCLMGAFAPKGTLPVPLK